MDRPRVKVTPIADRYHMPGERIVEFVFPSGMGGLISFRTSKDGASIVELYRLDNGVAVYLPTGEKAETIVSA